MSRNEFHHQGIEGEAGSAEASPAGLGNRGWALGDADSWGGTGSFPDWPDRHSKSLSDGSNVGTASGPNRFQTAMGGGQQQQNGTQGSNPPRRNYWPQQVANTQANPRGGPLTGFIRKSQQGPQPSMPEAAGFGGTQLPQQPPKPTDGSAPIDYDSIPESLLTPLGDCWCLWYTSGQAKTAQNFVNCLIPIGLFSTAEAFWSLYSHCIRPSQLPKGTEYHLFREGIKPMWEDPSNQNGGTLSLRLKKNYLDYYWESVIVAMIGEQLGENICGAVAGKRFSDDYIAVWNSRYAPEEQNRLGRRMLNCLGLPENSPTDYKSHSAFLTQSTAVPAKGIASQSGTEPGGQDAGGSSAAIGRRD